MRLTISLSLLDCEFAPSASTPAIVLDKDLLGATCDSTPIPIVVALTPIVITGVLVTCAGKLALPFPFFHSLATPEPYSIAPSKLALAGLVRIPTFDVRDPRALVLTIGAGKLEEVGGEGGMSLGGDSSVGVAPGTVGLRVTCDTSADVDAAAGVDRVRVFDEDPLLIPLVVVKFL